MSLEKPPPLLACFLAFFVVCEGGAGGGAGGGGWVDIAKDSLVFGCMVEVGVDISVFSCICLYIPWLSSHQEDNSDFLFRFFGFLTSEICS